MKKLKFILLLFLVLSSHTFLSGQTPEDLKVEYTKEPVGIDVEQPLFSWKIKTDKEKRGQYQKAYRIEVYDEESNLVWDSKKIESDLSVAVKYSGEVLKPRTRYSWTISSWDENDNKYKATSFFETGILDSSIDAWKGAKWIGTTMQDTPLASHYLSVFNLSFEMRLDSETKSHKAGFVFGANDSRLMSKNYNIQGVASQRDQSYILVELDIHSLIEDEGPAKLNIYRVGYDKSDSKSTPFALLEIPKESINKSNAYSSHKIEIDGGLGGFEFFVNETKLNITSQPSNSRVLNLNPIARGGDYISFPMLADIGFHIESNQKAYVTNLVLRNRREPKNSLFEEDLENYNGIFSSQVKIEKGAYVLERFKNQIITANPSKNGAPYLRTTFNTLPKKIAKARVYSTARGIYELYLNGQRISTDFFNPGLTQYNKTHMYQTYDITDLIKEKNAFGALLGEGWWSGNITFSGQENWNFFGDRQSFLCQLIITYEDGSEQLINSNTKDWNYFHQGPIEVGSFFQGEIYNATKAHKIQNWSQVAYEDESWKKCVEVSVDNSTAKKGISYELEYSNMELVGQMGSNVRPSLELTAKSVKEVRPGVYVYDMGQNMVGVPKIRINQGKKGNRITLRFAEVTYPDLTEYEPQIGMIMLENIRAALAQDIYIQKGGEEIIQPRFTFHGYRFLEITGIDQAIPIENVKGIVLSSVDELTADYETSNPYVNRLWENIAWSTRGNFLSIPTDCPQRNERMGWSGDINVFSKTATYLIDASQFFRRHLLSMREIQGEDGRFTDVAPVGGGFGGTLWGSAGVVVAWETYLQYGNLELLREHYPAMKRYVDFLETKQNDQGILIEGPLGDWLSPENSKNDNTAMWNAYQVYDLEIVYKAAQILGLKKDFIKYRQKYIERKAFFNKTYIDFNTFTSLSAGYESFAFGPRPEGYQKPKKGSIVDTQASYAIPLALNVYDEEYEENAAKMLVNTIIRNNTDDLGKIRPKFSLMTGFIGTASINEALSKFGHHDIAYSLLLNDQYPSWLYPVLNGATTIWERLNSYTIEEGFGGNNSMNSFNHYAFGAIGAWMQNYSLGIQRGLETTAFKTILLKPMPDPNNVLKWARGYYKSMYGSIESSWKIEPDKILYEFTIPANTTATLYLNYDSFNEILESGKKINQSEEIQILEDNTDYVKLGLGSGEYRFTVKNQD